MKGTSVENKGKIPVEPKSELKAETTTLWETKPIPIFSKKAENETTVEPLEGSANKYKK